MYYGAEVTVCSEINIEQTQYGQNVSSSVTNLLVHATSRLQNIERSSSFTTATHVGVYVPRSFKTSMSIVRV